MADLQSPQSAAGRSASEFLRWWKQHLWECVPASMRRRIVQSRRPAIWSPSDDRVWVAGATLDSSKSFTQSALAQRGGKLPGSRHGQSPHPLRLPFLRHCAIAMDGQVSCLRIVGFAGGVCG